MTQAGHRRSQPAAGDIGAGRRRERIDCRKVPALATLKHASSPSCSSTRSGHLTPSSVSASLPSGLGSAAAVAIALAEPQFPAAFSGRRFDRDFLGAVPEMQAHRRSRIVEAPTIRPCPRAEAIGIARRAGLPSAATRPLRRARYRGPVGTMATMYRTVALDKAGIDLAGGEIRLADDTTKKGEVGGDAEYSGSARACCSRARAAAAVLAQAMILAIIGRRTASPYRPAAPRYRPAPDRDPGRCSPYNVPVAGRKPRSGFSA